MARGPSDAVIRRIPEADAERAFAENPEERVERGTGKGSVAGIRVGEKGGQQGMPDIRQLQIAQERAARKGQGRGRAPVRPVQKPLPAPAAAAPATELADWEQEAAPVAAPAVAATPAETTPPAPLPADDGDLLARASRAALKLLAQIPSGMELYVGDNIGHQGMEIVVGLGYLVGRKFAAYRGNGHWRITNDGIGAYISGELDAGHE